MIPWIRRSPFETSLTTSPEQPHTPEATLRKIAVGYGKKLREEIVSIFQLQEYLQSTGRSEFLSNPTTYDPLQVEPLLYQDLDSIDRWEIDAERRQEFKNIVRGLIRSGTKKPLEPYVTSQELAALFGAGNLHTDELLQNIQKILQSSSVGSSIEEAVTRLENEKYRPLLHQATEAINEQDRENCRQELKRWQRVRDNLYVRLVHPTASYRVLKLRDSESSYLPRRAA